MSRSAKPNVTNEDNNIQVDAPFQLPSVPPWKTPKVKTSQNPYSRYNSVTPLRRPSTLLVPHLEQPPLSSFPLRADQTDEEGDSKRSQDEKSEYDYKPLSEKSLLRESKIKGFLQAERAAHCLIFHRGGHRSGGSDRYRPDLEYDCGEVDGNEIQTQEQQPGDSSSLLVSVPGCSRHDLNQLLNKNHMRQRPNVRRIDEILNHEFNAIKSFWGDSELATSLERNHLHEQYLLLQQEQKEIAQYKMVLRTQKACSATRSNPNPQHYI